MSRKNSIFKILRTTLLWAVIIGIGATLAINIGIFLYGRARITFEADTFENVDCILVLGCQLKGDGTPSHMLEDRLKVGIRLYKRGEAPKLLMSGDHGQEHYNEVGTMKQYAVDAGVPPEDVFMDHAGFSTYESIYRAKHIFGAKKIIIVTQKYHLYRALYIAGALGLEAQGVQADERTYAGQFPREVREVLARVKDFALGILQPKPTYLGDPIDLTGSGTVTNDSDPEAVASGSFYACIGMYSFVSSLRRGPNSTKAITKLPIAWGISYGMPASHQRTP